MNINNVLHNLLATKWVGCPFVKLIRTFGVKIEKLCDTSVIEKGWDNTTVIPDMIKVNAILDGKRHQQAQSVVLSEIIPSRWITTII